ncbi:MAG: anthranilate phosphoribosyltransferase [Phycisphaera sp.]|nr:anthranilate phosphoribosyltransferase [Phycisphaera sp.]
MDDIKPLLKHVASGQALTAEQATAAFEIVMTGGATEAQIAALLTALAVRPGGPSVDEITGAARVMRAHATKVDAPAGVTVIDTCGTGGDASGTFNISTTAALIAAGAGAHVAKHGNRSVTSKSGSSQVLEALGVNLQADGSTLTRCLAEARICFCFAPAHHPAMKHAVPVRQQLGFRTIFNVLGPLTNPAGATRQVMGVFDPALTEPIAHVLANLGAAHAMVVHGTSELGGIDEISTAGPTRITTVRDGGVSTSVLEPGDVGLAKSDLSALHVDGVEQSAAMVRAVLDGDLGPARAIAALNAAAALVVAGLADDLTAGLVTAEQAIDTGAARTALDKLVEITNG